MAVIIRRHQLLMAVTLAWILLSLYTSFGSWTLPFSLLSTIVYVAGVSKLNTLLALAFAMQLPALVTLSLSGSLLQATLLTLASAYLTELGYLVGAATRARCLGGYLRARAAQVTLVASLTFVTTLAVISAAEALSPPLDFGAAAFITALLAVLAYMLRAHARSRIPPLIGAP